MANTYSLINSTTLSTTAASVTFSSIPQTYTDLVILTSVRDDSNADGNSIYLEFNGVASSYSATRLRGNGATASSTRTTGGTVGIMFQYATNASTSTSNVFSSSEFYIPNYSGSQNKAHYGFSAMENNSTTSWIVGTAGLWSNTSAITQIKLQTSGGGELFQSGSSFWLYGIKNT